MICQDLYVGFRPLSDFFTMSHNTDFREIHKAPASLIIIKLNHSISVCYDNIS